MSVKRFYAPFGVCQVGMFSCKDSYVLDLEYHRCILVHANAEVKVQFGRQVTAGATIACIQNNAAGSKG